MIPVDTVDDTLLERLRERARDPRRRRDAHPTRFDQSLSGLSAGELRLGAASAAGALAQLVDSIQSGSPVHAALHTRARQIEVDMSTPADAPLAPPATEAVLDDVHWQLGVRLPYFLRRVYREVANGGIGPGSGLLSAGELLSTYRHLRSSPPDEAEVDDWPDDRLPLVRVEEGYYWCLDTSTGRISRPAEATPSVSHRAMLRLQFSLCQSGKISQAPRATGRAARRARAAPARRQWRSGARVRRRSSSRCQAPCSRLSQAGGQSDHVPPFAVTVRPSRASCFGHLRALLPVRRKLRRA